MVLPVWGWMVARKDMFVESPETVREWVVHSGEWMEWARKLMPLRRWAALVLALVLLIAWGAHEMQDTGESGLSSVASYSASSVVGDRPPAHAVVQPPGAP
eukprot:8861610-Pyramimonas_sp.AAC.2